jgi:Zn-dependent protease with chaperone function
MLVVNRARIVFWLESSLGCAALIVVLGAVAVAATRIDFALPSAAALAAACRRWAFPGGGSSVLVAAVASLALASLALTLRSALRQIRASRAALHGLRHVTPACGLMAFDDHVPRAFCAGFLAPRVYLSTGALELLSGAERAAVVAHEDHHVRRRDPLRLLVLRALADGLFFLPALRRLAARYAALAELAADEAAVRTTRDSHALASALLAFDALADPAVVGIAPERVDHLLGRQPRWELPMTLLAGAAVTVAGLAAVTLRLADATGHASIALPELLAATCMLAMALAPVAVGAGAILAGRRVLQRR